MHKKLDVARNYTKRSPEAVAAFWDAVSEQLNQLDPRQRDVAGWKKVWSDCKIYIKKKMTANKKEGSGTSDGPFKRKSFTPLKDSVIALISINDSVEDIGAKSFGTGNVPVEDEPSSSKAVPIEVDCDEENREFTLSTARNRRRNPLSSIQLLSQQVESQKKIF